MTDINKNGPFEMDTSSCALKARSWRTHMGSLARIVAFYSVAFRFSGVRLRELGRAQI